MPSPDDHPTHGGPPLPDAAHAALQHRGRQLLGELDAMRQGEAVGAESGIAALDPQAELALRRRGDELLSDLAAQRARHLRRPARPLRRWLALAAGLVGVAGALPLLLEPYSDKPTEQAQALAQGETGLPAHDPLGMSPAIPEPSSTLLALAGAVILCGRRRRPPLRC